MACEMDCIVKPYAPHSCSKAAQANQDSGSLSGGIWACNTATSGSRAHNLLMLLPNTTT